jgi:type III secretion system YscQ/HrcQ family protein
MLRTTTKMAAITTTSSILSLLALRTICGVTFDRLHRDERIQYLTTAQGSLTLKWLGHHRPRETAGWVVQWSNGVHQVALWLKPSPGAWIMAQSYFDRLPQALALAKIADTFQPLWTGMGNGPWVAGPVTASRWIPGGAQVMAVNESQNLTFEFELAFSSTAAARELAQCLVRYEANEAATNISVPCELHLGSLQLSAHRIRDLRTSDVLLGGIRAASSSSLSKPHTYTLTRLLAGSSMRTVALLQRRHSHWEVVNTHPPFLSEYSMENNTYFTESEAHYQSNASASSNPPELSDLQLRVDIVAGRLSLTVAEIQALRPGDVLEMTHALEEAHIEIRVGGRPYASGALVALEGRLAVQITKIDSRVSAAEFIKQKL